MSGGKNIFLIGYMGCGKTTMGKKLASRLGMGFVDLDATVVREQHMSVPEIFRLKGEKVFRRLERMKLLETVSRPEGQVVSVGGGTPCMYDNLRMMRQNGMTVYLKGTPAFLASRLWQGNLSKRPLLSDIESREELEQRIATQLESRAPIYEKAELKLELPSDVEGLLELLELK